MSARVGADIEALCRKCGDVWHVVVAMKDGDVARVECKQCGGQHRHRPPGGAEKKTRTRADRATKASKAAAPRKPAGPAIEPDLSRPVRDYRFSERYEVGERIEHRTYGTGIVEAIPAPGKVEVWFEEGRRMLVHGRA